MKTYTPLVFRRDDDAYRQWWNGLDDDTRQAFAESLAPLRPGFTREHPTVWDNLPEQDVQDMFRTLADTTVFDWLRVDGLITDVASLWLTAVLEYDSEGHMDGINLSVDVRVQQEPPIHPAPFNPTMFITTWVSEPGSEFAVTDGLDDADALAEIIDTALALINGRIATLDGFAEQHRKHHASGHYWGRDDDYPLADWAAEVANDETRLGYWEWVDAQRSAAEIYNAATS